MTPKSFSGPQEAFETILSQIIQTTLFIWEAKVKPHLLTFLSHPIVKELIGGSNAPAQPNTDNSPPLELQKIQDTLQQLSKAVEALKKAPPTPPSCKDANVSKSKQKVSTPPHPPSRTFLAIAGARPPNPSLLVNLANLGIDKEGRLTPETLC